jgi:uncharacterized protein YggE
VGIPRLAATVLAAVLFAGWLVTGCEAVNTASNTLDKAQLCTRALAEAGYTPDLSNPSGTVQEATRRAEELRKLAEQTTDADLKRELREMADQIGSLKVSDVNPSAVAEWANRRLTELDQLRRACG